MLDDAARLGRIVAMLEASDYPTRQHLARYRERLSKLKRQMETTDMTDNTHDTDAQLIETLRGLNIGITWGWDTESGLRPALIEATVEDKDGRALIAAAPAMRALILRQADELAALKTQLAAVTAVSTNTEHADNLRGRLMAAARDVSGRHNMNYGFACLADSGLILQSSVKADSFDDAKQRLGVSRYQVWALCRAPVDGRAHVFKMSWGEA